MSAIAADLESLWHEYHKRIATYIRNQGIDSNVTEDLAANVYLRAWVAMRNGNGYFESASGWLFEIARSVIIDYARYNGRPQRSMKTVDIDECEEQVDCSPTPHEAFEKALESERLAQVVGCLPEHQAEVVILKLCGYELEEIAKHKDKSYEAIVLLQNRAYHNLRRWLKEAA